MKSKEELIEKAGKFQDEFDKIHHESWHLSRHGVAVIMAEFALSLSTATESKPVDITDEMIEKEFPVYHQNNLMTIVNGHRQEGAKWMRS